MAKWGSTDFEELKKLRENLRMFDKFDRQALCEKLSKEIAARLLRMVVKRTPVGVKPQDLDEKSAKYWSGYKGGNLRRNWGITTIAKSGKNYVICVRNISEYASYVEYGHRQKIGRYVPALGKRLTKGWVKGRFMLTVSEKEIKSILPSLLEKRISQAIKEAFNAQ